MTLLTRRSQMGQMRLEKSNIAATLKSQYNTRFRNLEHDIDTIKRKLESHTSDRSKLFGARYTDNPEGGDVQLEQRQQLLNSTDRLGRSSNRIRRLATAPQRNGADCLQHAGGSARPAPANHAHNNTPARERGLHGPQHQEAERNGAAVSTHDDSEPFSC